MCGINIQLWFHYPPGSGKSTLAKTVLAHLPQFTRLSIDEIIFRKHGLYGIHYPADAGIYQSYQDEANKIYLSDLKILLQVGKDVILDRSFYARKDRDDFRNLISSSGARCILVYFKAADKELLWKRIFVRSQGKKDADSALDISRERFEIYWSGFEEPTDECEIVVPVR